jgi:hypothetical protein
MHFGDPPPKASPEGAWYIPRRQPTLARRKYDFLRCLMRWGTISEAAVRIGIDRRTAHRWRRDDPAFDEACRIRLEWRREAIILAASNRLVERTRRPIFRGSREIGHVARATDKMLVALLKTIEAPRRRPVPAGDANVPVGETSDSAPKRIRADDAKG